MQATRLTSSALCLVFLCAALRAEMATRRWGTPPKAPPARAAKKAPERPVGYATDLVADAPNFIPPKLDGELSDKVWGIVAALRLERTLDGTARAAQPTTVMLFHDGKTLYLAFRCAEPAIEKSKATRRPHDGPVWEDDSVEFFLGFGDTYYHFGVNAAGCTYDGKGRESEWSSGMQAAAAKGTGEWTAEVAIPLDKLTGEAKPPERCTANFHRNRYVTGTLEEWAWSPTYSGDSHVPKWFGDLLFREPPPRTEPPPPTPGPKPGAVEILPCEGGQGIVRFGLAALPRGAKIHRADLLVFRTGEITGQDEDALASIEILALLADRKPEAQAKPLELRGPWFDRFDATEAVRGWVSGKPNGGFFVKACPRWRAEATCLDVAYEGRPGSVPPQPSGLKVFHRAGQTFVTWSETEKRIADERATWGTLQKALAELDAERVVRYRVYRHTEPITAKNLAKAELLAEARPLSCYNVEGRSLEALIYAHRRRSAGDIPFARQLSANWYFGKYNLDMPEMAQVEVKRFVIDESGKPLPLGSGLFVHHPASAGKAHHAIATCIDGVTNTLDFSSANATMAPIEETIGTGEPVFQEAGTLKVFWDYPGERRYYVQWCAPPLANLPNQYFNWSIYLPADRPKPAPVRVFLEKDQYMRPTTPHRRDTILVSGRDGPVWSFWYGYHEALGTLKSFRQGMVQPYTTRRLFAFIDWAMKAFDGDPNRLSAVGGTEALYYGVKHADRFAYIMADRPDPNPKLAPAFVQIQGYKYNPPRPQREAVWGQVEWKIPNDMGIPVWDELDLIACVKADPKREVAFLSMGPASLSPAWPRQVEFMRALWEAKQPFCARFYWGGGEYLPLPETETAYRRTGDVFDISLDKPVLALRNNSNDIGLKDKPFAEGAAQYWSGGRIADSRRWLPDIVDAADRFETTIHSRARVAYGGGGTSDVTPRRCRNFKPKPGEKLRWENVDLKTGKALQSGEVAADEHGLVTIPGVQFGSANSRLRIAKAQ